MIEAERKGWLAINECLLYIATIVDPHPNSPLGIDLIKAQGMVLASTLDPHHAS